MPNVSVLQQRAEDLTSKLSACRVCWKYLLGVRPRCGAPSAARYGPYRAAQPATLRLAPWHPRRRGDGTPDLAATHLAGGCDRTSHRTNKGPGSQSGPESSYASLRLTSLRFSRASTTSLPSLRFLRVGWKRWLDAHRPRRCTPSRRDARSVSRRAARDPATHTRPIPSAPGRHEHLTATHLASGCDRCTHLMNSTRIPHAGRPADVRLHLTSLGVS